MTRWLKSGLAVCAVALWAAATPARAEVVFTNSGTIQTFNLTSNGTTVTLTFPDAEFLNNVNGHPIPDVPATFTDPLVLTILSSTNLGGGTRVFTFSSDTDLKIFGTTGGPTATFSYTMTTGGGFGITPDAFTVTGPEILLTNGLAPDLDFSPFFNGGTLTFALTATSRSNQGSGSLADLIALGGTASGSIAFSEIAAAAAVPEPASWTLLGLAGLAGGWYVRRRRLLQLA
jgi:hypothetical protein